MPKKIKSKANLVHTVRANLSVKLKFDTNPLNLASQIAQVTEIT